jgi:lipopolysaccharide export system protein LptA
MKIRFAAPVAITATASLVLGACSDEDSTTSDESTTTTVEATTTNLDGTTLAKGDVTFADSTDLLHGQTMDITAVEQDGQVTGEARFSFGTVLDLQCANTDTDGLVVVGGEVTAEHGDSAEEGDRVAVLIREGDPDSVFLWYELPLPEGEVAAGSCQEFVDSIAADPSTDDPFADIAEGDDIETS